MNTSATVAADAPLQHGAALWQYSMDRKGRLVLPLELKRAWGLQVVLASVTTGGSRRLIVWPPALWQCRERERGHQLQWWESEGSLAAVCAVERWTGRILVPHHLRTLFGLRGGSEVVVRRLGEVAEVLPLAQWEAEMRETR